MSDQPPPEKHYRLAIRRPVTTAMIFLTLFVFGWQSYQKLPLNLMPDITYPTLTIRTEYENAAPEDVEKLVTRPLEEQLSLVSGLVELSSISSAGRSEIIMEFTWDTDMIVAQQEVRDQLDLFEPPREVTEKPIILRYDPNLDPVMRVAITSPEPPDHFSPEARQRRIEQDLTEIREAAERQIKSDLEGQVGIAQVNVKGGREKEIQILADAERLKTLGLSLQDLANSLAQQNINLSGGSLREGSSEFLVRTLNEFQDVDEIRNAIVVGPQGQQVRLRDVARVFMGEKERETIVRLNGREAVELEIFKDGDANTVEACNLLKDLLGFERERSLIERMALLMSQGQQAAQRGGGGPRIGPGGGGAESRTDNLRRTLRSRLPAEAELTIISDQSRFIRNSIREVQTTAIIGGFLALMVLFFFLRELKATTIIGVAIPISVIATFIPMFMQGISLNIMSLGGLALGIGMLVDNSIVVLESIFRCQEEGDAPKDAAERGTHEVGSAVTAATLTTIAVFFPIAFVEGVAGQLFRDQALTVTFSLIASLIVALFLIPMIASRQSLHLLASRDVVWVTAAYRRARTASEASRIQAILAVPRESLRMARRWLAHTARETFGLFREAFLGAVPEEGGEPGKAGIVKKIMALVTLPFFAVLFVLYVLLQAVLSLFVTLLFGISVALISVIALLGILFKVVLWLPLKIFDIGFTALRKTYEVTLRQALHVSPVILLLVLLLAYQAVQRSDALGRELIPPLKQGEFGVRMEAPPGTRLAETERRARQLERIIMAVPEVESLSVEVGQERSRISSEGGENVAHFSVLLRNPDETAQFQDAIIEDLRARLARVSSDDLTFTLPTLFSFKTPIELQIQGDDLDVLREVGRTTLAALEGIPGLRDQELSIRPGHPEIIIELDRDLLATRGLSEDAVARRLRTELQGDVATRFNQAGNRIDVRVRTDQELLQDVRDLRRMSISDGFPPVPLEAVATLTVREGPSEVRRIDQRQVALITANVEGRALGTVSADIMARLETVDAPPDVVFFLGGQNREMETSLNSLMFALMLAVFLVYVVMACQFESIWHPALVMFSVPLAFIGVIFALDYFGVSLSIVVFIGAIVLAGIVVNNAIVLVDYINQLRARGLSKREAVIEGGKVRLRPILMTSLTTMLGLIPMAVASGAGAEIRQPMAITVMAGLVSSTFLTLFIIPMVYDLFGGGDPVTVETEESEEDRPTAPLRGREAPATS